MNLPETETEKWAKELLASGKQFDTLGRDVKSLVKDHVNRLEKIAQMAQIPLQSDEARVEIIMLVVRNDRDIALSAIAGILKANYPFKLTVYENSDNSMNTSKIWNKLIKQSTCGYVMLIDSDAIPQNSGWLLDLVEAIKKYPNAAVVGPVAGEKTVSTVQSAPFRPGTPPFDIKAHVSGYCMLFRRSFFDEYRYFDEDFYFYGQESDWIEEILEGEKYKIVIVPSSHVTHGIDGVASVSSKRMEQENMFHSGTDQEYAKALFEKRKGERGAKKT